MFQSSSCPSLGPQVSLFFSFPLRLIFTNITIFLKHWFKLPRRSQVLEEGKIETNGCKSYIRPISAHIFTFGFVEQCSGTLVINWALFTYLVVVGSHSSTTQGRGKRFVRARQTYGLWGIFPSWTSRLIHFPQQEGSQLTYSLFLQLMLYFCLRLLLNAKSTTITKKSLAGSLITSSSTLVKLIMI